MHSGQIATVELHAGAQIMMVELHGTTFSTYVVPPQFMTSNVTVTAFPAVLT